MARFPCSGFCHRHTVTTEMELHLRQAAPLQPYNTFLWRRPSFVPPQFVRVPLHQKPCQISASSSSPPPNENGNSKDDEVSEPPFESQQDQPSQAAPEAEPPSPKRKGFRLGSPNTWFRRRGAPKEEDVNILAFDNGEFDIQWREILDPTPENVLALLLTGLLGLAVLQIIWQLLLVALTITLAGLKYSVIAAILLALLIILL